MPVAMLSTSLITEPKRYGRFNALDTENPFGAKPGMVLIKPTSIDNSGGSASLGANGKVTYTTVNSVSVNGVFTSAFDNYIVVSSSIAQTGATGIVFRLRSSGVDDTGSNYVSQLLQATGGPPGIAVNQSTNTYGRIGAIAPTLRSGRIIRLYNPAVSGPTTVRGTDGNSAATARIDDLVNNHTLSVSYDGMTLYPSNYTMTGALQVYGLRS